MPSERVRTPLSLTHPQKRIVDMLDYIYEHYKRRWNIDDELQRVELYELITEGLSRESGIKSWKYRYIQSVRSGTLTSSKYLDVAIRNHYERLSAPKKKYGYKYIYLRVDVEDAEKMATKILESELSSECIARLAELLDVRKAGE